MHLNLPKLHYYFQHFPLWTVDKQTCINSVVFCLSSLLHLWSVACSHFIRLLSHSNTHAHKPTFPGAARLDMLQTQDYLRGRLLVCTVRQQGHQTSTRSAGIHAINYQKWEKHSQRWNYYLMAGLCNRPCKSS